MASTPAPPPSPFDADARPLWSIEDVLAWLDISRTTLERWRAMGDFPSPRVMPTGRMVRWNRTDLTAWWEQLEVAA